MGVVRHRYNLIITIIIIISSSISISSSTNSRRLRWAGHVARMEEGRNALKILAGKHTGTRPLGRPRRRWEDNIRMDLEEIGISAGKLGSFGSG